MVSLKQLYFLNTYHLSHHLQYLFASFGKSTSVNEKVLVKDFFFKESVRLNVLSLQKRGLGFQVRYTLRQTFKIKGEGEDYQIYMKLDQHTWLKVENPTLTLSS